MFQVQTKRRCDSGVWFSEGWLYMPPSLKDPYPDLLITHIQWLPPFLLSLHPFFLSSFLPFLLSFLCSITLPSLFLPFFTHYFLSCLLDCFFSFLIPPLILIPTIPFYLFCSFSSFLQFIYMFRTSLQGFLLETYKQL